MILDKLKAYGWMAAAIVAASALSVQTFRLHTAQLQRAEAVTTLANERTSAADARATQINNFRKSELSLVTGASETRKITNDKVSFLNSRSSALIQRMRSAQAAVKFVDLPSSTSVATDGQAVAGSAEPELLGSLGEADVLEAVRADTIRLHLEACYRDYDRAEAALKALGAGK